MKKILAIAATLTCAGCSVFGPAVPTTTLSAKIGGQEFAWSCPKQFSASNLVFSVATNGVATMQVGSVNSANDPLVIDKSYAGQIMLVKQWGDTANQLIQTGVAAAGKFAAAAPTNAPIPIIVTNAPAK